MSTEQILFAILSSHITLACSFICAGVLIFLHWRTEVLRCPEGYARQQFLLHDIVGGSWVLSVVMICAGLYFLITGFL